MRPGAPKKRWTGGTDWGVVKIIPGLDAPAQGELVVKGDEQNRGQRTRNV